MSEDNYLEQGYHIDRYHALEEDLLRFLDFVTLEFYPNRARQCIRSLYLADLLLKIGSNIDIFFYKYCIYLNDNFDNECQKFSVDSTQKGESKKKLEKIIGMINSDKPITMNYFKGLESLLKLSNKYVTIISPEEILYPFNLGGEKDGLSWNNIKKDEVNFWWNSYNKVKHEGIFDRATLDNIICALAALLILISLNKKLNLDKFEQYGYIHIPSLYDNSPRANRFKAAADVKTKIFIKKTKA